MKVAKHPPERASGGGNVVYSFPMVGGGMWAFVVPDTLAGCVGTYARIPEFRVAGHLLRFDEHLGRQ